MARYAGVLLDLDGVVFTGDEAIAGSVEALGRLREAGVAVRFLTNTTRSPRRALVDKLKRLGIAAGPDDIFTPAFAARHVLNRRVPHLLVHPSLVEDFPAHDESGRADVVLVGDAGEAFTYAALNAALRALENGATLMALAKNRVFQDGRRPAQPRCRLVRRRAGIRRRSRGGRDRQAPRAPSSRPPAPASAPSRAKR